MEIHGGKVEGSGLGGEVEPAVVADYEKIGVRVDVHGVCYCIFRDVQYCQDLVRQWKDSAVADLLTKSLESDINMNKIESVSNLGRLSSGVTKQKRQINKLIEASEQNQKQQKISNFVKLASQTNKLKEVRQNKQIQAAREKAGAITLQMFYLGFL